MKKIHYSRFGYNGNLTYTSVCGKIVKSHSDKETTTIDPEEANCKECKQNKMHKNDLKDQIKTADNIKRRIFIESDIVNADELRRAQHTVFEFAKESGLKCVDRVFSQVLDRAWHDLEKTWKDVKRADEIYADSALVPLCGGSYIGAPVIFNGMCERAIKENVTGKSVIILNKLKNIYWDMIDIKLMKQAFKKNELYMYNDDDDLYRVDVSKIKK